MPLTESDRERVRYHLGYLEVSEAAALTFGLLRPIETLFVVETAMTNLLEISVPRVLALLGYLDTIECRLLTSQERLAASKLGDLSTRENEPDLLEREYVRWAGRLADVLGAPFYPYSNRFRSTMMGGGLGYTGSIPVNH